MIVSRLENTAFVTVTPSGLMRNIFLHDPSKAEEAYEWIKRLEGVGKVRMIRMRIMKGLVFVRDWLDGQMKKGLSEAP